jgi:hypothetical protein
MHLGEAKFQSVVLLSIEERRALFATSISSRVDDAADDNLERSTWLASVPVLSYTQALQHILIAYHSFQQRIFLLPMAIPILIPDYRIYRYHISFAKAE